MSRIEKTAFLFLIILLPFSCKKESDAPPTDSEILGKVVKPEVINEYKYPILPGTPEWEALQSNEEMEEAVEIPASVLDTISTWGLVESCFKYPLGGDYMLMNCPSEWINELSVRFDGLNELFARSDVSTILLYSFRYLDLSKYDWFSGQYIELIVGCDAFVSQLNKRQLLYLVSLAIEKAHVQTDYLPWQSSLPYIMGNAMIHAGYTPFIDYCNSQNYIESGVYIYCHGDDIIEKYAYKYIGK